MRAIGWYLLLVGIPAAALVGILKLGAALEPPRAVHGSYAVTFDSTGSGRCLAAVLPDGERRLAVSQSGPRVAMSLGTLALQGVVTGDSVRGATAIAGNALIRAANCQASDSLVLAGARTRSASDTRLTGTFTFSGCAACSVVPFAAVRLPDRNGDND